MKRISIAGVLVFCCGVGAPVLARGLDDTIPQEYEPFLSINETAKDVSAILKRAARDDMDRTMRNVTGKKFVPTSKDRKGRLASEAHDRGATDFAPRWGADVEDEDFDAYAKAAVRRLGTHYKAIVERPQDGYDEHTVYELLRSNRIRKNGPYVEPSRATGDHIHIQPDRQITLPIADQFPIRPRPRIGEQTMRETHPGVWTAPFNNAKPLPAPLTGPRPRTGEQTMQETHLGISTAPLNGTKRLPAPFVGPPAPIYTPRVAPPVLPGSEPRPGATRPGTARPGTAVPSRGSKDSACSRNASAAC